MVIFSDLHRVYLMPTASQVVRLRDGKAAILLVNFSVACVHFLRRLPPVADRLSNASTIG